MVSSYVHITLLVWSPIVLLIFFKNDCISFTLYKESRNCGDIYFNARGDFSLKKLFLKHFEG
jgi:hypothetical protein